VLALPIHPGLDDKSRVHVVQSLKYAVGA
jgi:hypothetical protein